MLSVVSLSVRPDLVETTGTWRWEAFFKDSLPLADVLRLEHECATNGELMPTVLVLLEHEKPVGMIALCLDDLDGRPELNPWLAGVYVEPTSRGKGYALRLVAELEAFALENGIRRLSLYTGSATGLYSKAGWSQIEQFAQDGETLKIMQKHLT